jgi:outer membrane protein TolC
MTAAYQRFQLLSGARPIARDAYLEIESRYRGGAANTLEVLDAASAELEAEMAAIQAERAYYEADALARRWGAD